MPIEETFGVSSNNVLTFTTKASKVSPAGLASIATTTTSSVKAQNTNPGIFRRIATSIKNVFSAIINAFKKIFFWILPRELSSREIKFLKLQNQKIEYQKEKRLLEQYSTIALIDKAEKLQPEFDAFLAIFKKYNPDDACDDIGKLSRQIEIVKEEAKKDPKELKSILEEYYSAKIKELIEKIKSEEETLKEKS